MTFGEIWDKRFLNLAQEVSTWSKDPSTQVGSVLIRSNRTVASLGYNGFPRGINDDVIRLTDREKKYPLTVHAEMNAILNCNEKCEGYILYSYPYMPCESCCLHIIQAGIKYVISYETEDDKKLRWQTSFDRARNLFTEAGVKVLLYDRNDRKICA